MRLAKNIIKDGQGAKCVKCGLPAPNKVIKDGKDFPVCEAHEPSMVELLKANGFIQDLKGKQYVLYSGLLDIAHRNGLKEMSCEIIHLDRDAQFCMIKATVKGDRGTFVAHGDADPSNTGKMVLSAFIRMAETRAYARALRLYTGIGMTAKEELPPQE